MKAIETVYRQYRFRSRLEARWAVVFDFIGVKYEYELEGFDLSDILPEEFEGHKTYLPDFYFPEYDTYVEIKPAPVESDEEWGRLIAFGSQKNLLIVQGTPGVGSYFVQAKHERVPKGTRHFVFGLGTWCRRLWVVQDEKSYGLNCEGCSGCQIINFGNNYAREHSGMIFAYKSARAARFEYGEKPVFYRPDYDAQQQLTWEKIIRIEPRLYDLYQEALRHRRRGVRSRADCPNVVWYQQDGLKDRLCKLVGWGCTNPDLFGPFAYDIAYQKVWSALPDCNNYCCVWDEEREQRESEAAWGEGDGYEY